MRSAVCLSPVLLLWVAVSLPWPLTWQPPQLLPAARLRLPLQRPALSSGESAWYTSQQQIEEYAVNATTNQPHDCHSPDGAKHHSLRYHEPLSQLQVLHACLLKSALPVHACPSVSAGVCMQGRARQRNEHGRASPVGQAAHLSRTQADGLAGVNVRQTGQLPVQLGKHHSSFIVQWPLEPPGHLQRMQDAQAVSCARHARPSCVISDDLYARTWHAFRVLSAENLRFECISSGADVPTASR